MSHTYTLQLVHCVFSTKQRSPLIADPPRLWTYMRAIARNCQVNVIAIGGTTNHVHLLLKTPPMARTADVIRTLKANSSRWMNEIGNRFAWQDGYAAISVSPSQIPAVVRYIENQAERHCARSFEQEYLTLLEKSGVPFDLDQCYPALTHRAQCASAARLDLSTATGHTNLARTLKRRSNRFSMRSASDGRSRIALPPSPASTSM